MTLEKTGNYGSTEGAWLREEILKRDAQIAKSQNTLIDLQRLQLENNNILNALSIREEELNEKQTKIIENLARLETEVNQINKRDKKVRVEQEMSDKICRAIAGIFIVGLIATGIVVGVIRYA